MNDAEAIHRPGKPIGTGFGVRATPAYPEIRKELTLTAGKSAIFTDDMLGNFPLHSSYLTLRLLRYMATLTLALTLLGCASPQRYGVVPPEHASTHLEVYRSHEKRMRPEEARAEYSKRVEDITQEDLDGPIRVLNCPFPDYPLQARMARIEGVVEIKFVVNEQGAVESPRVSQSAGRLLDEVCMKAVRQWRSAPMTAQGQRVKVPLRQKFPFLLRGKHAR